MTQRDFIKKAVKVFDHHGHKPLVEYVGASILDFDAVMDAINSERVLTEVFNKALCDLADEGFELGDSYGKDDDM